MPRGWIVAALSSLVLPACANFEREIEPPSAIDAVAWQLQCELQEAYVTIVEEQKKSGETDAWPSQWATSYDLTLKRETFLAAGPHLTYSAPLGGNTGFGLSRAGIGIANTNRRTVLAKRTFRLDSLPELKCSGERAKGFIPGKIGVGEALKEAVAARGDYKTLQSNGDESFGYRVDFQIKLSAGVDPTWSFYRITGVGLAADAYDDKTNSVNLAFTPVGPRVIPGAAPRLGRGPKGARPQVAPNVPFGAQQRLNDTLQRLQLETLLPQTR